MSRTRRGIPSVQPSEPSIVHAVNKQTRVKSIRFVKTALQVYCLNNTVENT